MVRRANRVVVKHDFATGRDYTEYCVRKPYIWSRGIDVLHTTSKSVEHCFRNTDVSTHLYRVPRENGTVWRVQNERRAAAYSRFDVHVSRNERESNVHRRIWPAKRFVVYVLVKRPKYFSD